MSFWNTLFGGPDRPQFDLHIGASKRGLYRLELLDQDGASVMISSGRGRKQFNTVLAIAKAIKRGEIRITVEDTPTM